MLILHLVIRHLCDDRDERDEDRWVRVLGGSSLLEESSQVLTLVSAFAPSLFGFGHIWTDVPEVALLPTCEAFSLSLIFPVNVKEKILDLQGHTH
jgi:hypothetical protein